MGDAEPAEPAPEADDRVTSGEAWRDFCRLLEEAGEVVLAEYNPDDPLDVAEGYRMLTRLLRGSLESRLEYGDPLFPELVCVCHETIKVVAENPDNHYLGSAIDGRYDYRVWGTRGEARWLSFNTFAAGGFAGGGPGTGSTLHEHQLEIADDGTFEVWLSQAPHEGNWLPLGPESRSLAIRQTFLDKYHQEHAELHIERLGADGSPPAPLDPGFLDRQLTITGHYLKAVTEIGATWAARNAEHPNQFVDVQLDDTRAFKDPEITYHQAYFELADDESLEVTFTPPECEYWMIVLHNHWMETLDYRFHQIVLNNGTATYEPDGSVRCVVAQTDPGTPNWLDTAGHHRGTIGVRWVGPHVEDVLPTTRLVRP
jgi:Protein of unknown function (DUF1214)